MFRTAGTMLVGALVLIGCDYRNYPLQGPTVADAQAIDSITKAATVLTRESDQRLLTLAEETASASLMYAGLKKLESGSFEFACWLPCYREPQILAVPSPRTLMALMRIEPEASVDGKRRERWIFDDRGQPKKFTVVFTYSAGGGGGEDGILLALLNRKPDLVRITRSQ